MEQSKLVSIVIPTYNRQEDIIACLLSLFKINYPAFEVIVVDNASTDNTVEKVRKMFPQVHLVVNQRNLLATAARNTGLKLAKGDYVLFLDSDNIVHHSFLQELVKLAESDSTIGIVGPKMFYYKDPSRLYYVGADINLLTSKTKYFGFNELDNGKYDKAKETGHVPNAFLVKKVVIDAIGEFDEFYVMHYEESDFAIRAKKAGFKIIYCPDAIVWHNVPPPSDHVSPLRLLAVGSPDRAYYTARNRVVYMKRHSPLASFWVFLTIFFPVSVAYYVFHILRQGRWDIFSAYLRGSFDGLMYGMTKRLCDRQMLDLSS